MELACAEKNGHFHFLLVILHVGLQCKNQDVFIASIAHLINLTGCLLSSKCSCSSFQNHDSISEIFAKIFDKRQSDDQLIFKCLLMMWDQAVVQLCDVTSHSLQYHVLLQQNTDDLTCVVKNTFHLFLDLVTYTGSTKFQQFVQNILSTFVSKMFTSLDIMQFLSTVWMEYLFSEWKNNELPSKYCILSFQVALSFIDAGTGKFTQVRYMLARRKLLCNANS